MEKNKQSPIFLIAMVGPVGSGKSFIANILSNKLKAAHIRTDDIRVELRRQGRSYSRAYTIARYRAKTVLEKKKSVISDFDAVLPGRRQELKKIARNYGAKFILIHIKTPEKIILKRLRAHKYASRDLFKNSQEAIRVYFSRKKFHTRQLKIHPDFVINNARPLEPQIQKIVKKLKSLQNLHGPLAQW